MANVIVFRRSGRKFFEAQWVDPITGRKRTKSTKTTKRREAERFAARIEDKLNRGESILTSRTKWKDFRIRYEREVLPPKAPSTQGDHKTTMNLVERIINPKYLLSLNAEAIGCFHTQLRKEEKREYTIKGHLSNIRRFLRWAHRMGLIPTVPQIDMPKHLTSIRGRPITLEEFERMIDKTQDVVGEYAASSWVDLLEGLWWSGLRISEAMMLHWTDDSNIKVDLTGRRPMFQIQEHAEKARKFRILPIAPEFADILLETADRDRVGHVFHPLGRREPYHVRLTSKWVQKIIAKIGRTANVAVSATEFASAHDLRRSFGFRWSQLVMPPVLMELMRHESIQTTMQFYVGRNAEVAADAAWSALADKTANTTSDATKGEESEETESTTE